MSRLALALVGGALFAGVALAFRSRAPGALAGADVVNEDEVDRRIARELPEAVRKARKAGARGAVRYMGAGMTGIVLCDARGRGFKVARHKSAAETIEEESEWFEAAQKIPEVRRHVAKFYRWHPGLAVAERECVDGRPGRWSEEGRLNDLHQKIGKLMSERAGWTAPEFKGDSYVIKDDGKAVLIDASMPLRVGSNLANFARRRLREKAGQRELRDLAFAIRSEKNRTIPAEVADEILAKLPEV